MKKTNFRKRIVSILMAFLMLLPLIPSENYNAASSYTNAKEFYESCESAKKGLEYHTETVNGTIYYATKAKVASASASLKYRTVGFDISLTGNNKTVSFTVQRTGGSMTEIDSRTSGGYEYILYTVEDRRLFELATSSDPANAAQVLDSSIIQVKMDAILITVQGSTPKGGITEDGKGGFTKWGTIYRLKNSSDLKSIKSIFQGHDFVSYKNIKSELPNYLLQVRYNVQGLNSTSSTNATVGSGYSISDGLLYKNGSAYITKSRVINQMQLLNKDTISLQKAGYHLEAGQEWITKDNYIFKSGGYYMPKEINSDVGFKNCGTTLYANWKPNTYKITYDANGGTGNVLPTNMTYDVAGNLRNNTFRRDGYSLPAGAEWIDANGRTYANGQAINNLTAENGAEIVLYANWKREVYAITCDKQGGSGGTNEFFEQYAYAFTLTKDGQPILDIDTPTKAGHEFKGYYMGVNGAGKQIVDAEGVIRVGNMEFRQDATIYAYFKPREYTVYFNKNGGTGGTDSAKVTYMELYPYATAPSRKGYTFQGYEKDGELYYTGTMSPLKKHTVTSDITLNAKWIDQTPPETSIRTSVKSWSATNKPFWYNKGIHVIATAHDDGTGLSYAALYCGNELIEERFITEAEVVNDVTFKHLHNLEGAWQYRIEAIDKAGNKSTSYETVFWDITPPWSAGEDGEAGKGYDLVNDELTLENLTNFSISLFVSDYK